MSADNHSSLPCFIFQLEPALEPSFSYLGKSLASLGESSQLQPKASANLATNAKQVMLMKFYIGGIPNCTTYRKYRFSG